MALTIPEHARSGFLEEGMASSLPYGVAPFDAGGELNVIAAFKFSIPQPQGELGGYYDYTKPAISQWEVKADRVDFTIIADNSMLPVLTLLDTSSTTGGTVHEIYELGEYTYGWVHGPDDAFLSYVVHTASLAEYIGVYVYASDNNITPFCFEILPEQVSTLIVEGYELNANTQWKPGYPQWPSQILFSGLDGDDVGYPDDGQIEFEGTYEDPQNPGQYLPFVDKEVGWPEDAHPEMGAWSKWIFTGEVIFKEGYNIELRDTFDISTINFVANPGSGLGYGPDCEQETDLIYTINHQSPDKVGNINLGAGNCLSITRFGELTGDPDWVYEYDPDSNHLYLRGDCDVCCACEDFEAVYRALKLLNLRMAGYMAGEILYPGVSLRLRDLQERHLVWRQRLFNEQACRSTDVIQISQIYSHSGYFIAVQVYIQNNRDCAIIQQGVGPEWMSTMGIRFEDSAGEAIRAEAVEGTFFRYSDRHVGDQVANPEKIPLDHPDISALYSYPALGNSHFVLLTDMRDLIEDRSNKFMPGRYLMMSGIWYISDPTRYSTYVQGNLPITVKTISSLPGDNGFTLSNEHQVPLKPSKNLAKYEEP